MAPWKPGRHSEEVGIGLGRDPPVPCQGKNPEKFQGFGQIALNILIPLDIIGLYVVCFVKNSFGPTVYFHMTYVWMINLHKSLIVSTF